MVLEATSTRSQTSRSRASMRSFQYSSAMSISKMSTYVSEELMSLSRLSHLKIFTLLRDKDWDSARSILQDTVTEFQMQDESGLSLLGMAVGCIAPLDIIQRIKELNPNLARMKDCFQALPIHIGCLNGSSIDTISVLLSHGHEDTLMCLDSEQRTPLHNAVQYACLPLHPHEIDQAKDLESIRLIILLCNVAPEAVRSFDVHGYTPIDLAQIAKMEAMVYGEFDIRYLRLEQIYHTLKDASIALYRREKLSFENSVSSRTIDTDIESWESPRSS